MDFAVAQFSPIVISAVMATVVSHIFEGNFAAFEVPAYKLVSPVEINHLLFYFRDIMRFRVIRFHKDIILFGRYIR